MQRLTAILAIIYSLALPAGGSGTLAAKSQGVAAPGCSLPLYLPVVIGPAGSGQPESAAEPKAARPSAAGDQPDFNGDGCADLAVGVPGETIVSVANDGAVNVIYGGADGLTSLGTQIWHRDGGYNAAGDFLGDIQEDAAYFDLFGDAVAAGDFDRDGFTDLAIGVLEFEETDSPGGAVHVLYGLPEGLVAAGNQLWTQSGGWVDPEGDGTGELIGDIYGMSESGDRFGSVLTSGDFNGDGYADLAVGVPNENQGGLLDSGGVNVLFGSDAGLTYVDNQFLNQDDVVQRQPGEDGYNDLGDLLGASEQPDEFGSALAAGDFNADGYDELVVGVSREDIGSIVDAGAVNVVFGSDSGLVTENNQLWHEQAAEVDLDGDGDTDLTLGDPTGLEEKDDRFGYALATGYFNDDAYADLAVSSAYEDIYVDGDLREDAGSASVFFGGPSGLDLPGQQYIEQDALWTEGALTGDLLGSAPEDGDTLGFSLATGDFDGDGFSELAIGARGEGVLAAIDGFGAALVLYGTTGGLGVAGHLYLSRPLVLQEGVDLGHLVGNQGFDDGFGYAVSAADYDNDGYDELAVGVPGSISMSNGEPGGSINLLSGSSAGLTRTGNQVWDQGGGWSDIGGYLGDLADGPEEIDAFGFALR